MNPPPPFENTHHPANRLQQKCPHPWWSNAAAGTVRFCRICGQAQTRGGILLAIAKTPKNSEPTS